jgi:predicted Zn-ribbon and HTH transcriptional regulator
MSRLERIAPLADRRAAGDLAYLLRLSRIYLAATRPRVCADCGHLFTIASLASGRRCAACGLKEHSE